MDDEIRSSTSANSSSKGAEELLAEDIDAAMIDGDVVNKAVCTSIRSGLCSRSLSVPLAAEDS